MKMNIRFTTVKSFLDNKKITDKSFESFTKNGYNKKIEQGGGLAIPNATNLSWYKSKLKTEKFDNKPEKKSVKTTDAKKKPVAKTKKTKSSSSTAKTTIETPEIK